ncbi:MAG: iron-containing alcohol dehydrogenase [Spirochaetales bacterium]|nr:iron-containing alcohol dehydrogenase [Spirochaetales bacterium]
MLDRNFLLNSELLLGHEVLGKLGEKCSSLGKRALIICSADSHFTRLCGRVEEELKKASIDFQYFRDVKPNPESDDIEKGARVLKDSGADFILSIGGGSTIDTGKAVSLFLALGSAGWDALFSRYCDFSSTERDLEGLVPSVAIATTAGTGSHLTQATVVTHNGEKKTLYHPQLKPVMSFLDSSTQAEMPLSLRRITGFDAFTHAFESYISTTSNALARALSVGAMKIFLQYLKQDEFSQDDILELIYGDSMAGLALSIGGAGIPHPLSEFLGSIKPAPHGACLAVFYPAYLEHLENEQNEWFIKLCQELGYDSTASFIDAVNSLLKHIGLAKTMRDYGAGEEEKNFVLNHPAIPHLPWASASEIRSIIERSY